MAPQWLELWIPSLIRELILHAVWYRKQTNKQKGKYELTVFADQEFRYGLSGCLRLKLSLDVTVKLLVSSCSLLWMLSCGNGVGMVEQPSSKVIHKVISELHSLSDYWNEASVPSCGLSTGLLTGSWLPHCKWAKIEKEKGKERQRREPKTATVFL